MNHCGQRIPQRFTLQEHLGHLRTEEFLHNYIQLENFALESELIFTALLQNSFTERQIGDVML